MSEPTLSAAPGHEHPDAGVEGWNDQAATIFLSKDEIARLAESGTHCLIIPLHGAGVSGGGEDAVAAGASESGADEPRLGRQLRSALNAIAIGASIGAPIGLTIAGAFLFMSQKSMADVVGILHRAITLFA